MSHSNARRMSLWALLFLPLVAVGVAAALMLSWANFGAGTAQAVVNGVDMSMTAADCTTKTLDTNCVVPVGGTLKIFTDRNALGTAAPSAGGQATWSFGGVIKFVDRPALGEIIGADCQIAAENLALLPAQYQAACVFLAPPTNNNIGATYALDVTCNSIGIGTVDLVHGPNDTNLLDANANPHVDKGIDSLTIKCVPPNGFAEINVTDANDPLKDPAHLGNTCWLIYYKSMSGPQVLNNPLGNIGDNVGGNSKACVGGNLPPPFVDIDPTPGTLLIPIPGVVRAQLGDEYHATNIQTPAKYGQNNTKYDCTLVNNACKIDAPFVRVAGNAEVNFEDVGGNPVPNQCVTVLGLAYVCDGDPFPFDDGVKNGVINPGISLPINIYSVEIDKAVAALTGGQVVPPNKVLCDLIVNQSCKITFVLTFGQINVSVTDKDPVTNEQVLVKGRCVNLWDDPPANTVLLAKVCDGGPGDNNPDNGPIGISVGSGDFGIELQRIADNPATPFVNEAEQIALNKATCVIPPEKCSVSFYLGPPHNLKLPNLANLFLTNQGNKLDPTTCEKSDDVAQFNWTLSKDTLSQSPKEKLGNGIDDDQDNQIDEKEAQEIGGFSTEVRFDKYVCVNLDPHGPLPTGWTCFINDKDDGGQPDHLANIGCVSKKGSPAWPGLQLVTVTVRPQPEVYKLVRAHKNNGIIESLINQDCNVVDTKGEPIKTQGCDDAALTMRWLEGDVDGTCRVDVRDQQILAFRWGVKIGHLLFNQRFDLEPSGQINGDNDIDIKDVQFVFGRHGSACDGDNKKDDPDTSDFKGISFNSEGEDGPVKPPQPPKNPNVSNPGP